jgi:hypothetical protein
MLRPIIMIGCGGSGQKAVRYVRDSVARHLEHKGWEGGVPKAWQFLGIDTLTTQEDPDIPFLPSNDYISVSLAFSNYQGLSQAIDEKFGPKKNPAAFSDLQGWRPNPEQVKVPLKEGAGKLRAVGRMAGILALPKTVQGRIEFAFSQCAAGGPELSEVSRRLQVNVPPGTTVPEPLTIIIGSMAGGTGAGIMLDIVDLVRRTDSNGQFPVLVAFTPDIFGESDDYSMTANSAGFMSELMSAYWDNEASDSSLIPSKVAIHTRGPHSVFLIGRTNIDGLDLENSKNVYRAVGEALAAVTTSSTVQTSFFNFITANWPDAESKNAGGYGFQPALLKGVASSFGSATISIGRDRFRDYLKKLMHRSIIEHLSDGFESIATSILGEESKSMAAQAKISELNRRNIDRFVFECGLSEGVESSRQISNAFVSTDIMKSRLSEVSGKIKGPFNSTQQQKGGIWLQTLGAQQQLVKSQSLEAIDAEISAQLRTWGTELLHRVLRTSTEFSAALSMPVVLSLLETTRARVLESSALLKDEAKKAEDSAKQSDQRARGHLASSGNGSLQLSAGPVQETISDMSKAIVFEWSAKVKIKLAVALESVATNLISSLEAAIQQSMGRMLSMTQEVEGNPPLIAGWPKNDGVVPASFAPSPVEFFLEEYSTWPKLASSLLSRSLGDPTGLPIDPVEAARTLLIRGGFGGDGTKQEVSPLIWAIGHGAQPVWEPGQQVSVTVADGLEEMSERIESWIMRPATEMLYVLSEGLSSYLMPVHYKTGAAIPNHQERLAVFRQTLNQALMQSRPLIEVDSVMNSTVHPLDLSYVLNIQGFPFGQGHPAREVTASIIQKFTNTPGNVDWVFSSGEAESVLISNFLKYPVHPSVVTSFTKPLTTAMANIKPELLQSSFWQWRRARVLENFIPLPDALRIAAIRGFVVSRILGAMTVEPKGQNRISTSTGIFDFPKNLLTETDLNNFLPVLLEAMILTFAEAPTRGKAAFAAYGALIEYGTGGGTAAGFEIDGDVAKVLSTGEYGSIQIVDKQRADAFASDPAGRIQNAIKYLDANIARFDLIDSTQPDLRSWRNEVGSVEPVDTLTREILHDYRTACVQVREAILRFEKSNSTGTGGGVV